MWIENRQRPEAAIVRRCLGEFAGGRRVFVGQPAQSSVPRRLDGSAEPLGLVRTERFAGREALVERVGRSADRRTGNLGADGAGGNDVRNVEEEGADDRGAEAQQRQAIETAGVAAGHVLHHADIPGAEEAAEVADRVDPGDRWRPPRFRSGTSAASPRTGLWSRRTPWRRSTCPPGTTRCPSCTRR